MTSLTDNQAYCRNAVKDSAPEYYLCTLFADETDQAALYAILAFNAELAKTREVVSEPMLGEIRLQWWQEAIEGIYEGNVRKHPIVEELAAVKAQLDVSALYELINLRRVELESVGGENLSDIISHATKIGRSLHILLVKTVVHDEILPDIQKDIEDISAAWRLAGLARVVLLEDFNAATKEEALSTILPLAETHILNVKSRRKKAPKVYIFAYLYYWLARSELKSIAAGKTEPLTRLRLMAILLWRSAFPKL